MILARRSSSRPFKAKALVTCESCQRIIYKPETVATKAAKSGDSWGRSSARWEELPNPQSATPVERRELEGASLQEWKVPQRPTAAELWFSGKGEKAGKSSPPLPRGRGSRQTPSGARQCGGLRGSRARRGNALGAAR